MKRLRPVHLLLPIALGTIFAVTIVTPASVDAQERPCVAFGRDVIIAADKKNTCPLIVVNGDVHLQPRSTQLGSVNVSGGDLLVEEGAHISGHVAVMDGDVEIYGSVGEQLFATGDVTLGPSAVVDDVRAVGEVDQAEGAKSGTIQSGFVPLGSAEDDESQLLAQVIVAVSIILFFIVFAALSLVVAPGAMANVRDALRGSAPTSLAVGLIAALLYPLLVVLLAITLVGPLILLVLYSVGAAIGAVALGEIIGARLWRSGSRVGHGALGAGIIGAVLALGFALGLPLLCGFALVAAFAASWVLGAVLLTLFGLRPWPRPAPVPVRPTEGPSVSEPPLPEPSAADSPATTADVPPAARMESGPDTAIERDVAVGSDVGSDAAETTPTDAVEGDERPSAWAPPAEEAMPPAEEEPGAKGPTPGWGWADDEGGAEQKSPTKGATPSSSPTESARATELQRVPGITPIFSQLLAEAGIRSLDDLADANPDTVSEIISVPGVLPIGSETAAAWIRQAQELRGQKPS
jgi:predicted flap endonuclease-1-like 5' DNA nuclease